MAEPEAERPLHLRIDDMIRRSRAARPTPPDTEAVLREEMQILKFGGDNPQACRPQDLVETVTLVMEDGVILRQTITPGPAAPSPSPVEPTP